MKLCVGKEVELPVTKRYIQHNRSQAIGDIYDALVEIITNADDSYGRLFRKGKQAEDGGSILIECDSRRGQPKRIVVRDRAEGIDKAVMEQKLLPIGEAGAEAGSRGRMGRGLKDCAELGCLTLESIKDGKYYRIKLTQNSTVLPEVLGAQATKEERSRLGVPRGNGTSITLELDGCALPKFETLLADLPWHYALRDIMAPTSPAEVKLLGYVNGKKTVERLVHRNPEGSELVLDDTFEIDGYAGATAHLRMWRSPELLEQYRSRFERFGVLIKGKRAILECSMLSDEFRKNEASHRFFGRLDCPYLDDLMDEYDSNRVHGRRDPSNPSLIVDPSRRGLNTRHPFVQALLTAASKRFRELLAKEKVESPGAELANRETKDRLSQLAKLAQRFLREELDGMDGVSDGDWVDQDGMAKRGIMLVPSGGSIAVGEQKRFYLYVSPEMLTSGNNTFTVQCDSDALDIVGAPFSLAKDENNEGRLRGVFAVHGKHVTSATSISVLCDGFDPVEAYLAVAAGGEEDHVFASPLEFEREEYRVRQGSIKEILLLAKYPSVIADKAQPEVRSLDPEKVVIRGKCFLTPVPGTNYAEGWVKVEGRTLNSQTRVVASLDGLSAETDIKVVERRGEPGVPLDIKLVPKPFGHFRAQWSSEAGKSHVLEISGLHPSLKRYLGNPVGDPPEFPGQDSPLYRVLLAEIVAEAVCHKLMLEEAAKQSYELDDLRMANDLDLIIDSVRSHYHKRLNRFLLLAHSAMVKDSEAR